MPDEKTEAIEMLTASRDPQLLHPESCSADLVGLREEAREGLEERHDDVRQEAALELGLRRGLRRGEFQGGGVSREHCRG